MNTAVVDQKNGNDKTHWVGYLGDFDRKYFDRIRGDHNWIAYDFDNCFNIRYFTVFSTTDVPLGIIGVYDTEDDTNITHTVVERKYWGMGLSTEFKYHLAEELRLDHLTIIVNLDNEKSLRANKKIPGIRIISDKEFEKEYGKRKFYLSIK